MSPYVGRESQSVEMLIVFEAQQAWAHQCSSEPYFVLIDFGHVLSPFYASFPFQQRGKMSVIEGHARWVKTINSHPCDPRGECPGPEAGLSERTVWVGEVDLTVGQL